MGLPGQGSKPASRGPSRMTRTDHDAPCMGLEKPLPNACAASVLKTTCVSHHGSQNPTFRQPVFSQSRLPLTRRFGRSSPT